MKYKMLSSAVLTSLLIPVMKVSYHEHVWGNGRVDLSSVAGRAIAQAVSRRLPTVAARVWSCGIL
jgi:hypothetical protein